MKESFELNFCFKGNRTYVHGTDIFTNILKEFSDDISIIDLSLYGIVTKNISFSTKKPTEKDVKVSFKFEHNDKKYKFFGIEQKKEINCRYDYNEDEISKNLQINLEGENILQAQVQSFSFIENIVFMNKTLLENLYKEVNGKWYFTRLQIKQPIHIRPTDSLKLQLKSNFQFKLTKTEIFLNEVSVGFIYFSLIPKEL